MAEPVFVCGKRVPDYRLKGAWLEPDLHALGNPVQRDKRVIIPIASGIGNGSFFRDLDQIKELVGRGAAQFGLTDSLRRVGIRANVPENNQRRNDGHFALAGGVVMLVHIQNGFKQDIQIFVIKPGLFSKVGADEAANLVQAKGDDLLAAHCAKLVLRLLLLHAA